MRGLTLLCLVSLALSAAENINSGYVERQPHLEYGPIPIPPTLPVEQEESVLPNDLSNILVNPAYGSNAPKHFPQQQKQQEQPIVSKRFFIHSAPEEDNDEVQYKHITVGKPRKNVNVVFIRSPSRSAQRTVLKITPAINEERNFIYVLTKNHDANDIDAHVVEPMYAPIKPEVFYIKYKTNEEAEHAQRVIQSQYDILGGTTQISDEGVPQISSVIGTLDNRNYDDVGQAAGQTTEELVNNAEDFQMQSEDATSSINGYLPPVIRKY